MSKRLRKFKKSYAATHKARVRRITHVVRRPLFTIPIATFMVLLLLSVVAFITFKDTHFSPSEMYTITVSHDKQKQVVPTRATTVGELLKKLHISLNNGDIVEPSADTPIVEDNFRVNVYRAAPVTIVDGARKTFTYSAAATPRTIVKQAGIDVYPEDRLTSMPTDDFITEGSIGERVVIERATPINFNLYGTPIGLRTHAKTVGELLKERGVRLKTEDTVQPAANTPLTANLQVFVIRKGVQIVTQEEEVPIPTETVNDDSLSSGATVVRQQGSPGKKIITYQLELQNGQEVGRKVIQEIVSQEPVKRIIAKGTRALGISLQTWLYKLRMCESGGNYQINTGNGFYGAYQFSQATWDRVARQRLGIPYERADLAPPEVQDRAIIANTNLSKGGLATQNPGCYKKEGLSQFPPGS